MASTNGTTQNGASTAPEPIDPGPGKAKLHGRAFYESIGSPKYVVAPMVNQSEFAWRMLTRSFLSPEETPSVLAYSPMMHAKLYGENDHYRSVNFQPTKPGPDGATPWLDGNPAVDRPLFVQFCANDPDELLAAARRAAPHCDAVDLNLGCPQGIARKGHYGAFLQEDQELIFRLINILHKNLDVPVTAKIRILDTREATLAYARNVLRAGASILTVHGRRREQKGHMTGVADWATLRWLREQLPKEVVLFVNGNILQRGDLEACLAATGADGVMSAEGNLSDPGMFAAPPPPGQEGREYWRGRDGRGGWRVDAVMRRYMDIMHRYAAGREPPARKPLFVPGDDEGWLAPPVAEQEEEDGPPRKKLKKSGKKDKGKKEKKPPGPNYGGMQPHMFHLLRHFVSKHTDVRDLLARSPNGDMEAYEEVLTLVEKKVAEGLLEYERTDGKMFDNESVPALAKRPGQENGSNGEVKADAAATETKTEENGTKADEEASVIDEESSEAAVRKCRRPWWVAQPIVRPLPKEAMAKGAIALSKKRIQQIEEEEAAKAKSKAATAEAKAEKKADDEVQAQVLKTDDALLAG